MKSHTNITRPSMKNTRKPNRILTTSIAALLGVAFLGLAPAAQAIEYWDGAGLANDGNIQGGTGTWDNAVTPNWTNLFGTFNTTYTLGTNPAVFQGAAGTVTIATANTIAFTELDFVQTGYTITATGTGVLAVNGATIINVTSPGTATILAQMVNAGSLAVGNSGVTGTLILNNTLNNYSGGTTLNGTATLLSNSVPTSLGLGAVTIAGAGSTLGNNIALGTAISNDIIVNQNFNLTSGVGGLTLTNVNLGAATRTITSMGAGVKTINGTISGVAGTGVTFESAGGAAFTYGPGELATYTGATTVQNGAQLNLNSSNLNAAIIGSVVIGNNGIVQLLTTNQIADTSAVSVNTGGTFNLNGFNETIKSLNNAVGGGGNVTLGTATLTVTDSLGGVGAFNGNISGTGGLTKNGVAADVLVLGGINSYSGATTINGGKLVAGSVTGLSTASAFNLTGVTSVLDLGGFNNTIASLTGVLGSVVQSSTGPATLKFGDATATLTFAGNFVDGGGKLSLFKQGTGIEIVSGVNTYTGSTTIAAGTIQAGSLTALGGVVAGVGQSAFIVQNGGTLALNGFNNTIASLSDGGTTGGTVNNGSATAPAVLTFGDATSTTFKGTITNGVGALPLGITKQGTGTTTLGGTGGANTFTYTGLTTINGGVLKGGVDNAFGTLSAVTVNAAGTLDLGGFNQTIGSLAGVAGAIVINTSVDPKILTTGGDNTSTEFAGVLKDGAPNGILSLTKVGTGIFKLSGVNTYTGATTITGGTLQMGVASALSTGTAVTVTTPGVFDLNNFGQNIGSLAGTGNVLLGTATLTTGNDNTATNYSGVMSGTGALRKVGTAIFTISGAAANTFSGGTAVNDGTLLLSKTAGVNAIGTGPVTIGDGVGAPLSAILQLGASNQIADVSALTLLSDGRFDLNTFSETVGSIAGAAGQINLSTGTLTTGDATTTTFGGTIIGPAGGNLTKQGTGTWILTGANSYAGLTAVTAGVLEAGNNTALGTAAAGTTVANGATLRLQNGITITGEALTITGAGAGGANAKGALTVTAGSTASYLGPITAIGTVAGLNAPTIDANGGTLTLGTINKSDADLVLTNTGAAGGTINVNGAITGNVAGYNDDLFVTGVIANLNAPNTYLGPTHITSNVVGDGILNANVANALPTLNGRTAVDIDQSGAGGSKLNLGTSQSIASLVGTGTSLVTLGANTLTIGFGTGVDINGTAGANFAGVISGAGGITKDETSTQILSGANTYTGATTVVLGILQAGIGSVPATPGLPVTSGAFGVNSAVTITAGTLELAGFSNTIGSLAGAGGFVQTTGATATLATGSNNTSTNYFGVLRNGVGGVLSLTKVGTGTQTLSGLNTYTGKTTVNGGTLQGGIVNAFSAGSAVTVNALGTLDLGGFNQTIASLAGVAGAIATNTGVSTATLTTGGDNTSTVFGGVVRDGSPNGIFALTKVGTGTMQLSGANTYTGATTVTGGVLQAGIATVGLTGAFGVNSAVTVGAAGTLDLNNFNETIGSLAGVAGSNVTLGTATLTTGTDNTATTFTGVISGLGGLKKVGTGVFTLNGAVANTYIGGTTVADGTLLLSKTAGTNAIGTGPVTIGDGVGAPLSAILQLGASNQIADVSALTLNSDGRFDLNTFSETVGSIAGAAGQINLSTGTLTTGDATTTTFGGNIIGPVGGNLVKLGTGTWTLSGVNTYAGTTTVGPNGGILKAGSTTGFAQFSAFTVNAASTLDLGGFSSNIGSLAGAGPLSFVQSTGSAATLTTGFDNTPTTYGGVIQNGVGGVLTLTKVGTGTQILTGANTYTGLTTVTAGVLEAGNNSALGAPALGTTVALGATLRLQNGISITGEPLTITGAGSGAPGAQGALTVVAGATASYLGPITAVGTVLGLNAPTIHANGGTLTLGAINKSDADLILTGGGTINVNGAITGNLVGFNDDLIVDSTTANLNAANSYVGNTFIRSTTLAGTVNANAVDALPNSTNANIDLRTRLTMGDLTSTAAATTLNLNGGFAQSVQTLISPNTIPGRNAVVNLNAATSTLTIGNTNVADSQSFFGVIAGSGGITKDGASTQILAGPLSAANTYAGLTTVAAGILEAGKNGALGSTAAGTTVANGATLRLQNLVIIPVGEALTIAGAGTGAPNAKGALTVVAGATASYLGPITVAPGTTATINANAGILTLGTIDKTDATLTLNGGGTINANGAITGNLTGFNDDMIVDSTTANLNAANSYVGNTFIRSTLAAGTVNANVVNALPNSTSANIDLRTRLTMGDATSTVAPTTLNLNGGFAQSVQTLISPNTAPGLNAVVNLNTSTLTIGNTNAADSQSFFGTITGTGGIIKDGASTQIFAKNTTYTGPTTITNGTLQIDGASASAVTVQTPAVATQSTLAGSGNINAPVTIQSGGILDPGPVGTLAGTLTTGPLTLNGLPGSVASPANDSILNYDFGQAGAVGGALNDLTNVTNGAGTLVLDGVINVTQTTGGAFTTGAYRIFNYLAPIGNLTDNGLAIGALPNGFSAANTIVDTSVAGQVNLIALPIGPGFPPVTQYWDGPGVVGNGLIDGGSGTWNNFLTNWTTANGAVNSSWQSGIAVFGGDLTVPGGVQAATGGTATITDRIFVSGITFNPTVDGTTYTIAANINPGTPPAPAFGLYLLGNVTINTNNAAGDVSTISAPIFDSGIGLAAIGSITKTGAGGLALSAQNTYTGGTTLNAGTLDINASSIAVGAIPSVNPVFSGPIGTGQLTINGGIIGTTTATGATNAIGNAVQVNANFAVTGPVTFDGVDFAGPVRLNQAGATVITTNSGFLDFSGTIADAFGPGGGLTLVGGTSLIGSSTIGGVPAILGQVDASNTYAGLTTITGGALVFLAKNSGAVAIPGNLQIDGGATVRLDSFPPNVAGLGTTANQIATTSNVLVNGALDLSGINQAINGLTGSGTVQLNDANGAGVGGASIFTVNSGNFAGSIFDNGKGGQLVKNSLGILILTGNNPYVGNTTINAGNLQVDGFIGSKNTFVNSGGTLSGIGVIGGNVLNGGFMSPGHSSPGTLTVKGNYTQNPNGTLIIEIAGKGAGQHDLVAVGGKASLDGNLRIVKLGGAKLKVGDKVTFLTAAGGVSGKFANVSNPFATTGTIVTTDVVYHSNSVALEAQQGSFAKFAGLDGCGPNAIAVGKALDSVAFKSSQKKLINFLNAEPLGNLCRDFDLIAPEELASIFNIGISLANVQTSNLERRMDDIQAGATGFSASGYAMSGNGPSYSGDTAYGARGPAGKGGKELRAPEDNRWGLFVTGVGEFTNIGSTSNARGYDMTTGGFTIGVDYKVTPNFAIGINTGYARTGADLTGNGRVTVDGAKLGVYATYFTGTGFYVDAAVNGGYNSYDTRRSALQGRARGSTEGGEFNALFATGYDWKTGGLRIGPTASVQYTNVSINGFRERGSLAPLRFTDQSGESLRTALGMKASYDIQAGGVVIRPEVRASWQHEFGDSSFALDSRFANGAGNTFTVHGPEIGDDSLLLGAGFAVLWNERTSTYVYYDGELGRSNYDSNNVSGGVRMSF